MLGESQVGKRSSLGWTELVMYIKDLFVTKNTSFELARMDID